MALTDEQMILGMLCSGLVAHSGQHVDKEDFVKDMRRLAGVIINQDESWTRVSRRVPNATPEAPWDGVVWTGGPKFVTGWFDGTVWRKNNASGNDITAAVTHWRNLQPPDSQ